MNFYALKMLRTVNADSFLDTKQITGKSSDTLNTDRRVYFNFGDCYNS